MSLGKRKRSKLTIRDTVNFDDVPYSKRKMARKARKAYKHAQTRRDRRDAKRLEEL